MTATVEHVDWLLLDKITKRIVSEVKGVNRVLYDLTPKPTNYRVGIKYFSVIRPSCF